MSRPVKRGTAASAGQARTIGFSPAGGISKLEAATTPLKPPARCSIPAQSPTPDVKAELLAWQEAKREKLEKEKNKKQAGKPRFDPTPSKPKVLKPRVQNFSYGTAGTLLRAAHPSTRGTLLGSPAAKGSVLGSPATKGVPPRRASPLQSKNIQRGLGYSNGIGSLTPVQETCPTTPEEKENPAVDNDFLEMCLGGPDAFFEHVVLQQDEGDKENAIEASPPFKFTPAPRSRCREADCGASLAVIEGNLKNLQKILTKTGKQDSVSTPGEKGTVATQQKREGGEGDKENAIGGNVSKLPRPLVLPHTLQGSPTKQVDEDHSDGEKSAGSAGSEEIDLEDMFAFDPDTLADLVRKGTSMSQLTQHLQASYADALERRLAAARACPGSNGSESSGSGASTPRPEMQPGNVSQHMTPEEVTPTGSPRKVESHNEYLSTFAEHALVEAVHLAQRRERRSTSLRHRPSVLKRERAAVKAVEAFGRRSLVQAQGVSSSQEMDLLQGAVQSVVNTAGRRRRLSLNKAAEVLECVADGTSEPLEEWPEAKVDATVEIIQQAMDEAIKRHRRSIAEAVQQVSSPTGACLSARSVLETPRSTDPADFSDGALSARIHRAVSEAYLHRSESARSFLCTSP